MNHGEHIRALDTLGCSKWAGLDAVHPRVLKKSGSLRH